MSVEEEKPLLISLDVAAKFLGIGRALAFREAYAGRLPVKRIGRRIYVLRERMEAMMSEPTGAGSVQPHAKKSGRKAKAVRK